MKPGVFPALVFAAILPASGFCQQLTYPWKTDNEPTESLERRIPVPHGFKRIEVKPGSFADWLRHLPLKPGCPPVHLYNGALKDNQTVHVAVVDIDVGRRDLQQCADAVIRLRAEYLFTTPCSDKIAFHFTSGDFARWRDWGAGYRPKVKHNRVTWRRSARRDRSHANFRRYLATVFAYAGSASLQRELTPVTHPSAIQIGDVFIRGGHPGHAVIVVDAAQNAHGERVFLLAQSYMPAQDIHILHSPEDVDPWYRARGSGDLLTPEWTFQYTDLRRFPTTRCEK